MSSNIATTNAPHAATCAAGTARAAAGPRWRARRGRRASAPTATRMPTTRATQPAAASDCVMISMRRAPPAASNRWRRVDRRSTCRRATARGARARRRRRDRCRASGPPAGAAPGEPDRADPGGDREDPDEVRDLLEPVGHLLRRVQVVGLEDRDLAGVLAGSVARSVTNPNWSPSSRTSGRMSRTTLPFDVSTRLRLAVEHLDELRLREHGELDERVLDARPGEKVLRRRADEPWARPAIGLASAWRFGGSLASSGREVDVGERIGHLSRDRLLDRRDRRSAAARCS